MNRSLTPVNDILLVVIKYVFDDIVFIEFKDVVDIAFKLLILNCPFVEKLFKVLNIVVDVAFKLLILN